MKTKEQLNKEASIRLKLLRKRNYTFIENYLKTHSCVDCSESDYVVLEFDHVRGKKKDNISRMVYGSSIKSLEEEISKCDVRCANCHRRKTKLELKSKILIK